MQTKKRDTLSVMAEQARRGNITEASLRQNIAQFRKLVKTFRGKNRIGSATLGGGPIRPSAGRGTAPEGGGVGGENGP